LDLESSNLLLERIAWHKKAHGLLVFWLRGVLHTTPEKMKKDVAFHATPSPL
jgi:hypothetical protein